MGHRKRHSSSKPMNPNVVCLRQIHLSQFTMEKAACWCMKLGYSKSRYSFFSYLCYPDCHLVSHKLAEYQEPIKIYCILLSVLNCYETQCGTDNVIWYMLLFTHFHLQNGTRGNSWTIHTTEIPLNSRLSLCANKVLDL